jgi:hypothetical protein
VRVSCVPVKATDTILARMMAVNPAIRRGGFAKALAVISESRELYRYGRTILPDGYEIGDGVVTLIEVADTHPIRAAKAGRIAELADELDEYGWLLEVAVYDYMGGLVAKVPGWTYGRACQIAPPNCMDMTPAALHAYLEAKAAQS